jgi:hypothetical protein
MRHVEAGLLARVQPTSAAFPKFELYDPASDRNPDELVWKHLDEIEPASEAA